MKKSSGLIWGIAFLIFGIIVLLKALGFFNVGFFFWVSLIIIIPCFIGLFGRDKSKWGYAIGIGIGLLFMFISFDIIRWRMFGPLCIAVVFLIVGIKMIVGKNHQNENNYNNTTQQPNSDNNYYGGSYYYNNDSNTKGNNTNSNPNYYGTDSNANSNNTGSNPNYYGTDSNANSNNTGSNPSYYGTDSNTSSNNTGSNPSYYGTDSNTSSNTNSNANSNANSNNTGSNSNYYTNSNSGYSFYSNNSYGCYYDRTNNQTERSDDAGSRPENDSEYKIYSAILCGRDINFHNEPFHGAMLKSVLGAIELNLRSAIISKDVNIDATAVLGGVEIHVPRNAKVVVNCTPVLGGVEDKTSAPVGMINCPTIYVNATCVLGGVDVNY